MCQRSLISPQRSLHCQSTVTCDLSLWREMLGVTLRNVDFVLLINVNIPNISTTHEASTYQSHLRLRTISILIISFPCFILIGTGRHYNFRTNWCTDECNVSPRSAIMTSSHGTTSPLIPAPAPPTPSMPPAVPSIPVSISSLVKSNSFQTVSCPLMTEISEVRCVYERRIENLKVLVSISGTLPLGWPTILLPDLYRQCSGKSVNNINVYVNWVMLIIHNLNVVFMTLLSQYR